MSNEPYPNKDDVICSGATNKAKAAGKLKNILNSRALFCINNIFFLLFDWMYLLKFGKTTVPIAIPAIARLIWYILSA